MRAKLDCALKRVRELCLRGAIPLWGGSLSHPCFIYSFLGPRASGFTTLAITRPRTSYGAGCTARAPDLAISLRRSSRCGVHTLALAHCPPPALVG